MPGDFAVLDAAEFVVLLPQIGLDNLGRRQEAQDGRVPFLELVPVGCGDGRSPIGPQPGADRAGAEREARAQDGATTDSVFGTVRSRFHAPVLLRLSHVQTATPTATTARPAGRGGPVGSPKRDEERRAILVRPAGGARRFPTQTESSCCCSPGFVVPLQRARAALARSPHTRSAGTFVAMARAYVYPPGKPRAVPA